MFTVAYMKSSVAAQCTIHCYLFNSTEYTNITQSCFFIKQLGFFLSSFCSQAVFISSDNSGRMNMSLFVLKVLWFASFAMTISVFRAQDTQRHYESKHASQFSYGDKVTQLQINAV